MCGTVAEHEDDFCHDCGHGFDYVAPRARDSEDDEAAAETCPVCQYGEIQALPYGVQQCDACGYTARDWTTA